MDDISKLLSRQQITNYDIKNMDLSPLYNLSDSQSNQFTFMNKRFFELTLKNQQFKNLNHSNDKKVDTQMGKNQTIKLHIYARFDDDIDDLYDFLQDYDKQIKKIKKKELTNSQYLISEEREKNNSDHLLEFLISLRKQKEEKSIQFQSLQEVGEDLIQKDSKLSSSYRNKKSPSILLSSPILGYDNINADQFSEKLKQLTNQSQNQYQNKSDSEIKISCFQTNNNDQLKNNTNNSKIPNKNHTSQNNSNSLENITKKQSTSDSQLTQSNKVQFINPVTNLHSKINSSSTDSNQNNQAQIQNQQQNQYNNQQNTNNYNLNQDIENNNSNIENNNNQQVSIKIQDDETKYNNQQISIKIQDDETKYGEEVLEQQESQILDLQESNSTYSGNLWKGLPTGQGSQFFIDTGITYKGEFKMGKKHGKGYIVNSNLDMVQCEFINGQLVGI
ncbi:hypothetical protein PPERSA_12379 [Pseudocohnilembus persalinus]|uniref:MORN motif n=1 Tax=Pseudocohnilembus persalinus TaxID=266149 RepID=A0A0V0QFX4_PSEPJ|nr:hypothetical protein PPERSA_12379 [Pseudocohnilembus persalinus]|eukprot:KRX01099.1 hypothetical protein PPERSA_12379 [Pseudocohnilembus persalinus]